MIQTKFHFDKLQKFDVLVCESEFVVFKHYIIYLDNNLFIHNTPQSGVSYESKSEVLKRKIVKVIRPVLTTEQRSKAEERIIQTVGFYYDAIDFNCEHFTNFILFGKRTSKQAIETITNIIALFMAAKMTFKNGN